MRHGCNGECGLDTHAQLPVLLSERSHDPERLAPGVQIKLRVDRGTFVAKAATDQRRLMQTRRQRKRTVQRAGAWSEQALADLRH